MTNFVKKLVTSALTACVLVFICIVIRLSAEYALWATLILTVILMLEQGDDRDV